jgi:hypothetical protein
MKLPDFLIIGAMKAGTTTLYRDMMASPDVYMSPIKEPHALLSDTVLSSEGRAKYANFFPLAKSHQLCGEASTGYTKLPTHIGVPERAVAVLGSDLKVIYLVREPVARVVSHHYHSYATGAFGPDIDHEVRTQSVLLDYTRYAMQIEPWIEALGRANVLILIFEEYIAARRETVRRVSEFLGITSCDHLIDKEEVYNRSDGKPARSGFLRKIRTSGVYRQYVQPYLPIMFRDRVRRTVLPKAPPRPQPPGSETVAFIRKELAAEMDRLRVLMGRDKPLWSQDSVMDKSA